jgi:hypothetical protein
MIEKGYIQVLNEKGETIEMTKNWQIPPDVVDYIVYKDGNIVKTKNTRAGKVEYEDSDLGEVLGYLAEILPEGGGSIYIASGTYNIHKSVEFWQHGIKLIGDRISYGTRIFPQDDFTGDAVFVFKRPSTGVGLGWEIRNIYIDFQGRDVANGIEMYTPYDNVLIENVRIVNVGDTHSALVIDRNPEGPTDTGQSLTAINVYASHKNYTATAPVVYINRLQEAVFINLKVFGGPSTTEQYSPTSAVFVNGSRGLTFLGCSFAYAKRGIEIRADDRKTQGILIDGATFEGTEEYSLYAEGNSSYPIERLYLTNPRFESPSAGVYLDYVIHSTIDVKLKDVYVGSNVKETLIINRRDQYSGTFGKYGNAFISWPDYYNKYITVWPGIAIAGSDMQTEVITMKNNGDVTATGKVAGQSGLITKVDVGDYGGNFANYTPPAGEEGLMVIAIDTNSTSPGKRLYIYANGQWNYVDLT